ncbi:hypothetical protein SAMN04515671_0213 [Nakamurella panacisegetis]|uniref:Uncharacterized protein n=1 Tax=Nakamurella panacisegetis TaxID=1090615 RepID=A0A1H0HU19_9ACTN|nr:hypothetical protein [Nakamurella panacisegetis]SDO22633.1 hypothetical protein SAMN04515671_0213 [Nakamurella panacisegetis]
MPPRKPPRPTPPDVEVLRTALDLGKIVKVGIAPSDQFPDGVTGRVRRIGDPAVDGEEFVFVEVPVGGAKDVLPFAPGDLIGAPPRRSAGAVATAAAAVPSAGAPKPRSPLPPSRPAGRPVPPAGSASALASAAAPTPAPGVPTSAPAEARTSTAAPGGPKPAKAPAVRGRRAPVTITISTTGDESAAWRIDARIGAKVAVRPTVVAPSRVWEIVQSLGEPKLTELVQTLLDDHRRSTQARADALAAELSALQAELSSFPDR